MAGLAPIVTKKEFKNWVKGSLAVLFTKDGLTDFVSAEVDQHHHRLLQLVTTATMTNTCNCTINSLPQCTRSKNHRHIVSGKQLCSRGVCNILMDKICEDHRFKGPSWKNTDPQKWCTDAFEVAKCFMPPDGYSDKTSLPETDFNGILAVIINNRSFTTLIQANLETEPNICTKARNVGREIRHTKDYLLSDTDLKDFIDDLINLLSDPAGLQKDPSAKDAITKLRMLKANDLTIHDKDVTEALRDDIRETLSEEHRDILHKINEHFSQHQTDSVAVIDRIVADRKRELEELANKLTDNITRYAELKKLEIEQYGRTKEKKDNEEKLKDFQKELMKFYRDSITTIPLSFLVEENDVPLLELYVKPPMAAVDLQQWRGDFDESPDKIPVKNYKEMLIHSNQTAFRNVYVTAEAGVGKTSLCNHIGLTWYHSQDGPLSQSLLSEDANAMKLFDFCFLISLREVSPDLCNVDDFIYEFLTENLPDKPDLRDFMNMRDFMNNILNLATCSKLIVLDGLDEWVHPKKCHRKQQRIPHAKGWNNCTIITTTRLWKFDEIRLPSSKIDRHIEIYQLGEVSLSQLAQNAIKLLNDRSKSRKTKSVEDFHKVTDVLKFGDFRSIPYIHLQTVCLWHDDLEIGKSKFEVCTNIVNLILKRGLEKLKRLEQPHLYPAIKRLDRVVQNKVQQIAQISFFLKSLSKLAFYTLFVEALPKMVTFDKDKALEHIDLEIDLELYLKLGLLSQKKSFANVSNRGSNISFPQMTLQEYFAAMYIYNNSDRENTYKMICNKCTSIQSILEMSNVFTFLSGFNPDLLISENAPVDVHCVLSSDAVVEKFRNGSCLYFMRDCSAYNVMLDFQTMQLDCLHEIQVHGQYDCFPCIEDIIINTTSKTKECISQIKPLIMNNQSHIKSLSVQQVSSTEECTLIWQSLNIRSLESLEMLQLWADVSKYDLESILSQNAKTLKSIDISNAHFVNNKYIPKNKLLSRSCLDAITNMHNLKIIHLEQISLNHGDLEDMVNFVSCHKKMTHIGMMYIKCATHNCNCNGVVLDLSGHKYLLGLCLHNVFVLRELYVKAELLEVFMIGKLRDDIAWHCLGQIPPKPVIHTLSCRNLDHNDLSEFLKVTQRCLKLQKLYFFSTPSMIRICLDLSTNLNNLEFVDLHRLEITCSAFWGLVRSVSSMKQTVNITLDGCTVLPNNEYKDLKMKITTNACFRVQFDGTNPKGREEFRFQKVDISS